MSKKRGFNEVREVLKDAFEKVMPSYVKRDSFCLIHRFLFDFVNDNSFFIVTKEAIKRVLKDEEIECAETRAEVLIRYVTRNLDFIIIEDELVDLREKESFSHVARENHQGKKDVIEEKYLTPENFEDNYDYLVEYLRYEDTFLENKEFRAVLYAMNGMTDYRRTKKQAIKEASNKFKVTQVFIREYIDKLGIVSTRYKENQARRREMYRQEYVLLNQLEERLSRENYKEKVAQL